MSLVDSYHFDPEKMIRRIIPDRSVSPNHPYADFIARIHQADVSGADTGDSFAGPWKHYIDDLTLRKKVTGAILLDLGGGSYPLMQDVAEKLCASTYINVDRFAELGPVPSTPTFHDVSKELNARKPEHMDVIYLHADILDIIGRMDDNTEGVVFVLNGIDDSVISKRHRFQGASPSMNYHELLAKGIARVLPPDGTVLTCASTASDYFERFGFRLAEGYRKEDLLPEVWINKT